MEIYRKNYKTFGIVAILILLAVFSFFGYRKFISNNSARQAVFLTSGEVMFGYVASPNSQMIKISDVYYIKDPTLLDPTNANNQKKVSLIQLGSELQGPQNYTYVNRDHILYFEDMKDNSKINDAIQKFKDQAAASATATTTASASQTAS